ncbi:phosphate ABC transporter permease subunit PstC [Cryobacterium frigoriphilum]|uniref:Phosphate transport system permease protein n=1 Tax=Cryobacterium frigoriphilum TaxID=1259150 RepID=A0A4V3IRU2_9MICO|nr:phosphate ABC transporter permease subunit PstC [Cryobacterium frigoriphilum]
MNDKTRPPGGQGNPDDIEETRLIPVVAVPTDLLATEILELILTDSVIDQADTPDSGRRRLTTRASTQDRIFEGISRGAGTLVLTIMSLVGLFLLIQGNQALSVAGFNFFTTEAWDPNSGNFGIAAVLAGTILIAVTAIVLAVPLAVATALYISEYAPLAIRQVLTSIVDLMAAVPSVVYGLWGMFLLEPNILGVSQWISTYCGWIPVFAVTGFDPNDPLASPTVFTASTFIAAIVVALMVAPIATSIMREVFTQAPIGEREAALALGATKWGMIRSVVLPFGRGGMIGGTMLGLGRALGETIAVYLIISPVFAVQPHILEKGSNSISALIALRYNEASPFEISALMAAGLALFVMTLFVNFGASIIISKSRSGASSD